MTDAYGSPPAQDTVLLLPTGELFTARSHVSGLYMYLGDQLLYGPIDPRHAVDRMAVPVHGGASIVSLQYRADGGFDAWMDGQRLRDPSEPVAAVSARRWKRSTAASATIFLLGLSAFGFTAIALLADSVTVSTDGTAEELSPAFLWGAAVGCGVAAFWAYRSRRPFVAFASIFGLLVAGFLGFYLVTGRLALGLPVLVMLGTSGKAAADAMAWAGNERDYRLSTAQHQSFLGTRQRQHR